MYFLEAITELQMMHILYTQQPSITNITHLAQGFMTLEVHLQEPL